MKIIRKIYEKFNENIWKTLRKPMENFVNIFGKLKKITENFTKNYEKFYKNLWVIHGRSKKNF